MIVENNDYEYIIDIVNGIWKLPMYNENADILKEVPRLNSITLPIEKNWSGIELLMWSNKHYYLAHIACIIYALLIYLGPKMMEKKKGFSLKTALKYWNLFLAVFSMIGTTRMLPYISMRLFRDGFTSSVCSPSIAPLLKGPVGLWLSLFVYSKYFELLDTVFIILRKRSLSFLHWFHHLTVLLYTWDAFVSFQTIGVIFCLINYFVHSIMYFYYYLACCNIKPKWGIIITILQILQMIIGTILTVSGMYYSYKYPPLNSFPAEHVNNPFKIGCHFVRTNGLFACLMYISYFALFLDFFVRRYIKKSKSLIQPTINKSLKSE